MQNNIGEARRSYEQSVGKFTQEDAARLFGVSLGTYRNWEQGIGRLNGEVLCSVADAYGVSTDYLLCRTNDPTPYPPAGTLPQVSREEKQLLKAFRDCTPREKDALLTTAEAMADNGNAKNMDDSGTSEAMGA